MMAPLDTAGRLRRLLAILAWLAQVGEAPIDEVAARFDLSPQALVTELEMAACCGVPPYTPDQLMEIVVTESTVSTWAGTALARPRRLSPPEGFALAASARALLAVPGSDESGALSRALAKLDRALGGEEIAVELGAPALLPMVRTALAEGRRLAISYYSASTDRVTDREISPRRVFASDGHWYVDAYCGTARDERRFRVDRIGAAEMVEDDHPTDGLGCGTGGHANGFPPVRPRPRQSPGPTVRRTVDHLAVRVHSLGGPARVVRRPGRARDLRRRRCLARTPSPPAGPQRPGYRPPRVPGSGVRGRSQDPSAL